MINDYEIRKENAKKMALSTVTDSQNQSQRKKQYSTFKVAQSTVMERKDNPVNN